MQTNNNLDHTFLDNAKTGNEYICLIVLNQPVKLNLFKLLYALADYSLYVNGGSETIKNMISTGELYILILEFSTA